MNLKLNWRRGTVKNMVHTLGLGAAALLSAGLLLGGCSSAPDLTQAQALQMIQAKYDQTPPESATVVVDDLGMREGLAAKYWTKIKEYPNRYWGDFAFTPEGKKLLKLTSPGAVIEWRPASFSDTHFSVRMQTLASNRFKAHDISSVEDETSPGMATSRSAYFIEGVVLNGAPEPLQKIGHNPGNTLSTKRQAEFVLDGGAWKLQSIR